MKRLDGRTALVTGGARGIGAATARRLASEGARIVIGDLLDELGGKVVAEIAATGGQAVFLHMDVTQEADWTAACALAKSRFGGLDILVNNAGIVIPVTGEDTTLEQLRRLLAVNVEGVFLGTKICLPLLREAGPRWKGGASIINLSSIAGLIGSPRMPAYGATKGAVLLLSRSMAMECCQKGYRVRVNAVHPGVVDSDMGQVVVDIVKSRMAKNEAEARAMLVAQHPIGRLGQPEDIAAGIAFLASDDASFMTGSSLVIDGGYTAQ